MVLATKYLLYFHSQDAVKSLFFNLAPVIPLYFLQPVDLISLKSILVFTETQYLSSLTLNRMCIQTVLYFSGSVACQECYRDAHCWCNESKCILMAFNHFIHLWVNEACGSYEDEHSFMFLHVHKWQVSTWSKSNIDHLKTHG